MTQKEQELYFLKKAAIHELGHAMVARHYGNYAYVAIFKNTNSESTNERLWLGQMGQSGKLLGKTQMRRVCIAGNIAEYMIDIDNIDIDDKGWVEELMRDDNPESDDDLLGWSESDWAHAKGWSSRDFSFVFDLLMNKWNDIKAEMDYLIDIAMRDGSATSDGNMEYSDEAIC